MKGLTGALRPVLLPLGLILAVSALLLAMDPAKQTTGPAAIPRVAIVQHASQGALDDGVAGMLRGLEQRGYVDGKTVHLQKFNAQGELATANDIARRVTDGSFDLVLTASTASLQAVANVNRTHHVPHVFGIVALSAVAGVGVSATDPLDHPAWMAGMDSFLPVEKPIALARRFNPGLRRLGLVWHTSEANSEAYTKATREVCRRLGIELLEANIDSPSAVGEAAASLAARGAEAFIVTGDVMVLVSIDSVIKAGRDAGAPTFSLSPGNVRKGTLFDLGADFMSVGIEAGNLAADVLGGKPTRDVPVVNRVPERLNLNLVELARYPRWQLPAGVLEEAKVVIDRNGERNDSATRGR